jgi:hypothetical protein
MKVFVDEREMRTAGGLTLTDITEEVEQAVAESAWGAQTRPHTGSGRFAGRSNKRPLPGQAAPSRGG